MSNVTDERQLRSTDSEDLFTTLFAQVCGLEKTALLVPQLPVEDIYGGSRFVDFALRTIDEKVAFEIDGLTWHVPDKKEISKYEDDLLRQNSLIYQGWRVFRWTDRQIAQEPEQVKEQLALFLERIPGLLAFDDFLPRQHGEVIELRPHQEEALAALGQLRSQGNTIALVMHAQGAGKTVTAIMDARRLARLGGCRWVGDRDPHHCAAWGVAAPRLGDPRRSQESGRSHLRLLSRREGSAR
ncbi:MAG TPA: DEAD/DEAH box helicase family protein [Gemmataceae bacterium]|jgi:hypothetical protein